MKKRKYQQAARAEQTRKTREQIVKAAVKLHEALGPVNTSIKAIAEEAGVQRLTVYRHFEDDVSLFEACTSHWFGLHPPPPVSEEPDPRVKSEKTLLALYHFYRQNERMLYVAYRDAEEIEALRGPMGQVEGYFDIMRDALVDAWNPGSNEKKQLAMTLRHVLRFSTWRSFKTDKLSDKKIVELVMGWL